MTRVIVQFVYDNKGVWIDSSWFPGIHEKVVEELDTTLTGQGQPKNLLENYFTDGRVDGVFEATGSLDPDTSSEVPTSRYRKVRVSVPF